MQGGPPACVSARHIGLEALAVLLEAARLAAVAPLSVAVRIGHLRDKTLLQACLAAAASAAGHALYLRVMTMTASGQT